MTCKFKMKVCQRSCRQFFKLKFRLSLNSYNVFISVTLKWWDNLWLNEGGICQLCWVQRGSQPSTPRLASL